MGGAERNPSKHLIMTNYRRNFLKGGTDFVTVALADRGKSLLVDHIDALCGTFRQVKAAYPFDLDAMVALSEHLHCIWTLPADNA
jgi:putative transposase